MENVILAAVILAENRQDHDQMLDETRALCRACGRNVAAEITQVSRSMDPSLAFRKGKIEELKVLVRQTEADLVIFQNELPAGMAARIADAAGCSVIDRTALILDIFSLRARTRQARIQTEIARLRQDLPSVALIRADSEGHSRGGSVTNRGAGERRGTVLARKNEARIRELEKELGRIEQRSLQDERRRRRTMYARAALVGYTNAGKSSLMNALLETTQARGQTVEEKDMLFATLDTSVRTVMYKRKTFFLYDTVGFVSDLPHTLIEAFHTTLSAALDADLLIHVSDAADPQREKKEEITKKTLEEIGAGDIPVLTVYNKIDAADRDTVPGKFAISCRTKEGIEELLEEITARLYPPQEELLCRIPYEKSSLLHALQSTADVHILEENESGMLCRVRGVHSRIRNLYQYTVKENNSYE